MYSPTFSAENKIFCLSLHYNVDNSYFTKLKPKNLKLKQTN